MSIRAVSDTSGTIVKEITYDTYGNILSDTNTNFKVAFGFAGGLYDSDTNLYGYVLGDSVEFVDPGGEWTVVEIVIVAVSAYYTIKGIVTVYHWFRDAKDNIDNPKELSDPEYHKQICDTAEGFRDVGKEVGHDLASAGIPFSRPIRQGGALIYDIAQ